MLNIFAAQFWKIAATDVTQNQIQLATEIPLTSITQWQGKKFLLPEPKTKFHGYRSTLVCLK